MTWSRARRISVRDVEQGANAGSHQRLPAFAIMSGNHDHSHSRCNQMRIVRSISRYRNHTFSTLYTVSGHESAPSTRLYEIHKPNEVEMRVYRVVESFVSRPERCAEMLRQSNIVRIVGGWKAERPCQTKRIEM